MIGAILSTANVVLLVSLVACLAGALAGLVVLVPFVGGAWGLNLAALVAYERWTDRGDRAGR
jgi:hypothetical protein